MVHISGPFEFMSKNTSNSKQNDEAKLLALLKKVLPKATHDAELAGKIYQAVESELKAKAKTTAFEKFCDRVELPNLEPKTVEDVTFQFAAAFAEGDVTIQPDRKNQTLTVEVSLPNGAQFSSEIKVRPVVETSEEQEVKLKFVPFPLSLPGDPELIWSLAKHEHLTSEEAGMALSKVEEDFWASKAGQKCLRDRVERSFPEFIARAPAGMLGEVGLKRHYKLPEPLRVHRALTPQSKRKS
jgi:hypothetical protein